MFPASPGKMLDYSRCVVIGRERLELKRAGLRSSPGDPNIPLASFAIATDDLIA